MWKSYSESGNGMESSTMEMISRYFMDYIVVIDKCLRFEILSFPDPIQIINLDIEERACEIMVMSWNL